MLSGRPDAKLAVRPSKSQAAGDGPATRGSDTDGRRYGDTLSAQACSGCPAPRGRNCAARSLAGQPRRRAPLAATSCAAWFSFPEAVFTATQSEPPRGRLFPRVRIDGYDHPVFVEVVDKIPEALDCGPWVKRTLSVRP